MSFTYSCDFYTRVADDFEWYVHQRVPSHTSVPSLDSSRHGSISDEDSLAEAALRRSSTHSESPDTTDLYEHSLLDDQSDIVSDLLYPSLFPLSPIALNEMSLGIDQEPCVSITTAWPGNLNQDLNSTQRTDANSSPSTHIDLPSPPTVTNTPEKTDNDEEDWNNSKEIDEDEDQDEDEHFYDDIFEPLPARLSQELCSEYQEYALDTSSSYEKENPYEPAYPNDEYDEDETQDLLVVLRKMMDDWDTIKLDEWEAIQDCVSKELEKDHSENPHIWEVIRYCMEILSKRIVQQVPSTIKHKKEVGSFYTPPSSSSDTASDDEDYIPQGSESTEQTVDQISLRTRPQPQNNRKRRIDCVEQDDHDDDEEGVSDFVADEEEQDDEDDEDDDDAYDSDYSYMKRSSNPPRSANSSSSSRSSHRRRPTKRSSSSSSPCKTRKNYDKETTRVLMDWFLLRGGKSPEHEDKTSLAHQTQKTLTQVSTWFQNARRRHHDKLVEFQDLHEKYPDRVYDYNSFVSFKSGKVGGTPKRRKS